MIKNNRNMCFNLWNTIRFAIVIIAVIYAPMISMLIQTPILAAFSYFAADTFYYLAVADHSVDMAFYTFDGQFPTNGFHPLWQYYLTTVFKYFNLYHQEQQILLTFYSSIFLTSVGTALFGISLNRIINNFALSLLSVVPGLYYFIFSSVDAHVTNQWSFINGMESPLSIFCFGGLVYILICKNFLQSISAKKITLISLILTLITLARLDDIFLFVPFWGFIIYASKKKKALRKNLLAFIVPPVLLIGSYLLYNLSYAGIPLPISGITKGGFSLIENLKFLKSTLVPNAQHLKVWMASWRPITWHILQIVTPALVSITWIGWQIYSRKQHPKHDSSDVQSSEYHYYTKIITLFSMYAFIKGFYNLANVYLWHQGQWYFPISIMIFNMVVAVVISKIIRRKYANKSFRYGMAFVVACMLLLNGNAFTEIKVNKNYGNMFYKFWQSRDEVAAALKKFSNGHGIIEFDDGIISYSLRDYDVMHGFGFVLDKEASEYKQRGELLSIAYQRGYRFLTSLYYWDIPQEADTNPGVLKKIGLFQDYPNWHFSVAYREPKNAMVFIQFEPIHTSALGLHSE